MLMDSKLITVVFRLGSYFFLAFFPSVLSLIYFPPVCGDFVFRQSQGASCRSWRSPGKPQRTAATRLCLRRTSWLPSPTPSCTKRCYHMILNTVPSTTLRPYICLFFFVCVCLCFVYVVLCCSACVFDGCIFWFLCTRAFFVCVSYVLCFWSLCTTAFFLRVFLSCVCFVFCVFCVCCIFGSCV